MGQVTTVWQIKTHKSFMRSHDSLVDLQIGRRTAQALHIDAPFLGVEVEGLESTSLAGQFDRIDMLVSTIVSGAWVAFRILVGHWRSQCIEDGARGDIFGGNEDNRFSLTLDL